MAKRSKKYALSVVALAIAYYGALALTSVCVGDREYHSVALITSTLTLALSWIYLCDKKKLRADITILCTMALYWVLLLPLTRFARSQNFFLNIDDIVLYQGIPSLVMALAWYAYHSILASLDKGKD